VSTSVHECLCASVASLAKGPLVAAGPVPAQPPAWEVARLPAAQSREDTEDRDSEGGQLTTWKWPAAEPSGAAEMIDNLREFVLEPGPEDYLVHCRVTRNNRGLDRGWWIAQITQQCSSILMFPMRICHMPHLNTHLCTHLNIKHSRC
jgi:hypothetical protein